MNTEILKGKKEQSAATYTAGGSDVSETICALVETLSRPTIAKFGEYEGQEIVKANVARLIVAVAHKNNTRGAVIVPASNSAVLPFGISEDWFLISDLEKWQVQTRQLIGEIPDPVQRLFADQAGDDFDAALDEAEAWIHELRQELKEGGLS